MSHSSTCDHSFHFCGKQMNKEGVAFCPCDGCISKFSCRGYWNAPRKKAESSEIALPILLTNSEELVTRLDPSHQAAEVREPGFCTIA
ncbi:hypothetical protein [Blastopirellula marina]|uniref:Uncharacterized protein n=1 Tax=Blastopirellula marina TaxID=124 RepID=A0A2S8FWG8_9BACT|nr:hypothetical protein [Blastopirellula marina]PQO36503.1 hypothetical protein C5Y98_12450 [Blastopirellula marina]PTL44341.1 hypothetical protein C5Y97_12460 [Blastopirellula marina]